MPSRKKKHGLTVDVSPLDSCSLLQGRKRGFLVFPVPFGGKGKGFCLGEKEPRAPQIGKKKGKKKKHPSLIEKASPLRHRSKRDPTPITLELKKRKEGGEWALRKRERNAGAVYQPQWKGGGLDESSKGGSFFFQSEKKVYQLKIRKKED